MYLALGIVYLISACVIVLAIALTTIRTALTHGEMAISKKNLFYFAPIFVLLYLLFLTAQVYNGGATDFFTCFSLLGATLEVLTKFKVSVALVLPICTQYPVYYAAFVLSIVGGCATVILSIASFFSQHIRNRWTQHRLLRRGCDVVLGNCEDALRYAARNRRTLVLMPELSQKQQAELVREGYAVLRGTLASLARRKCGPLEIIVFRSNGVSYSRAIEGLLSLKAAGIDATLHLEAEQAEVKIIREKLIAETDKRAQATINCFSKHELIARKFVTQYPITRYIPRDFFAPNCALREGKHINVVFIGFGKMNYQLFRMFSMQFQFAVQQGERLAVQPVRYYVYDNRDTALHNEFFSRILFEMGEDFKDCDFPAPEPICDVDVNLGDINSVAARQRFRSLVTPDSFTYFVISIKGDLEDASYAQTVRRLLPEEGNYRIFVRSKRNTEVFDGDDRIIFFGNENELYARECLVNDDLSDMAKRIHVLYSNIGETPEWLQKIRALPVEEQEGALRRSLRDPRNARLMQEAWDRCPAIEQASNLYHALNLPFKLNLLGFSMVKREGEKGITEEEFDRVYHNTGRENGYRDPAFFFRTQSSNVLAFIEHSRWNALYILRDYKQMKKGEMPLREEKDQEGNVRRSIVHKDPVRKLHACLTTYYGLKELIDWKFERLYGERAADVDPGDERLLSLYNLYRYDYMDLDRLYAEITAMGYKLVPKKE